ncbi:hypothetical protein [Geoalkalibacter halelectricus]|uniref:CcmD family protein n=1 Tax=Geoalkalibacter halelectricus TaxID=2847045 RepID=A0ABY5ZQ55_9BACT|nr:hypothetical protein [Geoalkalibacter halelectricus]MDO3378674.1 hypothetical protein [Geoalkalibacter halelectricus]UWZ80015.1 hypothetical protein L9S41_01140 [Geoalkalibacter halelectricus]
MRRFLEMSGVFFFLLLSSSAAFAASNQVQGPGSLLFILLTAFLGYCALLVGLQLFRALRPRPAKTC